ncbi:NAD-dependent epimerase/dehydratase family protein [Salinisphaera aquimarina]|uniref:NAD-dependent epimerase/dehydratase family protein n=1 Tax=Salinisphaera aquimarina TaxID=2094031 RepID=A0ABV7EVA4_9GAMM
MKILILGGDGFCGWPTALHLSGQGHDVTLIDNLSRRHIDTELGVGSLTPISPLDVRLNAWKQVTGHTIAALHMDVAREYDRLEATIERLAPDAIVHFAEQRSAPYSMKHSRAKRYTVENNLSATQNVLCALVETGIDAHLVHLGTMGVYGYGGGLRIPEGYLTVEVDDSDGIRTQREILFPPDPGSIYHMTKTQDQLLFYFYNKNDGIRITDLHQGVVWGTQTRETRLDERLINRFDYDGDYGTVLNRFLMQAAIGHDLTVHGSGGQTRAFIHIQDTVRCIGMAIGAAPAQGERVRIFNQMTETWRVGELAALVARLTGAHIAYLPNPRREAAANDLCVDARCLLDLGLEPTTLRDNLLTEIVDVAERYADRCDRSRIPSTSQWVRTSRVEQSSALAS